MRNARESRHLLTGFYIRHVQDLVHVQIVVLQLPEQSLWVVGSTAAAAAEALGFPFRPIGGGGGGGRRGFLKAGVIFTGLPWLPQALVLELPIRLRVRSLRLVFEGRHPLHRAELAVDLSQSAWFDDSAAVGGNAAAPVDGRSCRRCKRKLRISCLTKICRSQISKHQPWQTSNHLVSPRPGHRSSWTTLGCFSGMWQNTSGWENKVKESRSRLNAAPTTESSCAEIMADKCVISFELVLTQSVLKKKSCGKSFRKKGFESHWPLNRQRSRSHPGPGIQEPPSLPPHHQPPKQLQTVPWKVL